MERRLFLRLGSGAAIGGALGACGGGGDAPATPTPPPTPPTPPAPPSAAIGWNNVALAAMRSARTPPTIAARALAIVHTAMYDAWAAYTVKASGTRYGGALRQPAATHTDASKTAAVSYAAYTALIDLFPAQQATFSAHLASLGYAARDAVPGDNGPAAIGSKAATALIAWRRGDGANQAGDLAPGNLPYADYSGYVARNPPLTVFEPTARSGIAYPSLWQPLRFRDAAGVVRTQGFLTPFWGRVRPFALSSASQFRPGPPAASGTPAWAEQAREIVEAQRGLTDAQMASVDYWAGGTAGELPTALWSLFAQFVSRRDDLGLDADIKLFFALSNALFDASIAAWDAKRAYDSVRPISAIRHLYSGQSLTSFGPDGPPGGLRVVAGEAWMPFQPASAPTPAHPDYVSGHSTLSAASAAVLKRFTGSDHFGHGVTIPARSLLIDPARPAADVRLSWDSFSAAAEQAGQSRILGGIHFASANVEGRALGYKAGAQAFLRAEQYWSGQCGCD